MRSELESNENAQGSFKFVHNERPEINEKEFCGKVNESEMDGGRESKEPNSRVHKQKTEIMKQKQNKKLRQNNNHQAEHPLA